MITTVSIVLFACVVAVCLLISMNPSLNALWQWHGRFLALESRGDRRQPAVHHRVVYHLSDIIEAPNEVAALVAMQARHPNCQTTGFFHMGPVKPRK